MYGDVSVKSGCFGLVYANSTAEGIRGGHDDRDEFSDFLDRVLVSGGDDVACEDFRGEQRSARDPDFSLG